MTTLSLARPALSATPPFELAPQVGYAGTFTTGLSPYGAFVGLGLHVHPGARLWLGVSLFAYAGARAAADGPGGSYRVHDRAYGLALDATWRLPAWRLVVEPGAEAGAFWIVGDTYVTPTRASDRYVAGDVGPVVRLLLPWGSAAVGVEAAALYVPSNVAAPVLRAGALVAVPF